MSRQLLHSELPKNVQDFVAILDFVDGSGIEPDLYRENRVLVVRSRVFQVSWVFEMDGRYKRMEAARD